jgi:chemotaxis methyl-accepting protein methylase
MKGELWLLLRERFKGWSGNVLSLTAAETALETLGQLAAKRNLAPARYLDWLDQRPAEQQAFIERLVIRTTWFMREPDAIMALASAFRRRTQPRPDGRGGGGQRVTIWSVACASGEEPYSLAMAFLEAGLEPIVLATDISADARAVGEEGEYPGERVDDLPSRLRQRFFQQVGPNRYKVTPALRSAVTFAECNLARSTRPPGGWASFDVIVCRNVLLYFERSEAQRILSELAGYCRGDGYVLLSAAEHPLAWSVPELVWHRSHDIPLLRRRRGGSDDLTPMPERTPTPLPVTVPSLPASLPVPLPASLIPANGSRLTRESGATPADLRGWVAAAQAATRLGHYETALNLARALVNEHPLYAAAHLSLGLMHKSAGRMNEAAAALRKARFLYGDDSWLAPYSLAVCLESTGERAEALEAYRHARVILENGGPSGWPDPDDNQAHLASTALESCRKRIVSLASQQ